MKPLESSSAFFLLLLPGLFAYATILNSDLLFTTLLLSILALALNKPRRAGPGCRHSWPVYSVGFLR